MVADDTLMQQCARKMTANVDSRDIRVNWYWPMAATVYFPTPS